ncbi:DUF3472 domain-containing protein [Fulvivirga sp. M361]|uniref:DUF3472 domain-containing protein n=1 Tax=Fulvivirga sp. M361 TaxID=2594266 RepID=UPI001625C950|nr:DUF3472 domain-containing protein [Fulvivirga sp. M361]
MKIYHQPLLNSLFLTVFLLMAACQQDDPKQAEEVGKLDLPITISPGGNSWIVNNVDNDPNLIFDTGIHNWTSLHDVIRTYFHLKSTGDLHVGLSIKSAEAPSTISVTIGEASKEITIQNTEYQVIDVGVFEITNSGYNAIDIQGLQKNGTFIADVNGILVGGPATVGGVAFVPDDFSFHFGRRGPSVHLSYKMPENKDALYFYNEVTVPVGEDVIGSYYMANGFGEGYFGIQVNSETERRVLFSVWSPYTTDDPTSIPDDYKIILLGKGEDVNTGQFGGEGSGGQSYKIFDWKAGNTYKFLIKAEPSVNESTDYTAYFYAPEDNEWKLMASFRRPHTTTYLTRVHSFLENFVPSTGFISRKANYSNQWVYDTDGNWHELTSAKFTADATARNEARLDYAGGIEGDVYFMKNCGFFNDPTSIDSEFFRTANGINPPIDFSKLPKPELPVEPKLLDKSTWTVIDFSTQEDQGGEGDTGRAADILDGNKDTYYHSCWNGCTATPPHHISIDMSQSIKIDGFRFTQRQTLSRAVKDIELQISSDNNNWESLGDFVLQKASDDQDINLSEPKTFRYFKFIVKSAHDGESHAAMAEISPYSF